MPARPLILRLSGLRPRLAACFSSCCVAFSRLKLTMLVGARCFKDHLAMRAWSASGQSPTRCVLLAQRQQEIQSFTGSARDCTLGAKKRCGHESSPCSGLEHKSQGIEATFELERHVLAGWPRSRHLEQRNVVGHIRVVCSSTAAQ